MKKIGQLFGIDVKFVEENQKKIIKEKDEIKEEKKDEIKEEKKDEIKEEIEDEMKVEKKDTIQDFFNNSNIDKTSLNFNMKGKDLTKESKKSQICNGLKFTSETGAYVGSGFSIGSGITSEVVQGSAALGLSICGVGLAAVGAIVGVGLGAYFTHKFCEDLIDKFVNYYKQNAEKIKNSYEEALKYFNTKKDELEIGENILGLIND